MRVLHPASAEEPTKATRAWSASRPRPRSTGSLPRSIPFSSPAPWLAGDDGRYWTATALGEYDPSLARRFVRVFHGHETTEALKRYYAAADDNAYDVETRKCVRNWRLLEWAPEVVAKKSSFSRLLDGLPKGLKRGSSNASIYVTPISSTEGCGYLAVCEAQAAVVALSHTNEGIVGRQLPRTKLSRFAQRAILVEPSWLKVKHFDGGSSRAKSGFDRVFDCETRWLKSRFLDLLGRGKISEFVCPRAVVEARIEEAVALHIRGLDEDLGAQYERLFAHILLDRVVVKLAPYSTSRRTSVTIVTARTGAVFRIDTDDARVRRIVRPFCSEEQPTDINRVSRVVARWLFLLATSQCKDRNHHALSGSCWRDAAVQSVLNMTTTDLLPNVIPKQVLVDYAPPWAPPDRLHVRVVGNDDLTWIVTTTEKTIDRLRLAMPARPVVTGTVDTVHVTKTNVPSVIDTVPAPNGPVCDVSLTLRFSAHPDEADSSNAASPATRVQVTRSINAV